MMTSLESECKMNKDAFFSKWECLGGSLDGERQNEPMEEENEDEDLAYTPSRRKLRTRRTKSDSSITTHRLSADDSEETGMYGKTACSHASCLLVPIMGACSHLITSVRVWRSRLVISFKVTRSNLDGTRSQ